MKRTILISLFLLLSAGTTIAQDETFHDGRKWVMREYTVNPHDSLVEILTCVVNGDTTLGGERYKKVCFQRNGASDISMLIRRDGSKIYQRYGSYGKWNPDTLVFDENWTMGNKTTLPIQNQGDLYAEIIEVGELQGRKYWDVNGWYTWLQDVGYIRGRMFFDAHMPPHGGKLYDLICCTEANGDTLYVNRDFLYMLTTGISGICVDDIPIKQQGGECTVTLPTATKWSATLYGSNGATVAHKVGEGSEIILPAESKGTHILLLDIDGKQYTKKVVIK